MSCKRESYTGTAGVSPAGASSGANDFAEDSTLTFALRARVGGMTPAVPEEHAKLKRFNFTRGQKTKQPWAVSVFDLPQHEQSLWLQCPVKLST